MQNVIAPSNLWMGILAEQYSVADGMALFWKIEVSPGLNDVGVS